MEEELYSEEEILHANKEGYLNIINTRNVETKLGIVSKTCSKSWLRLTGSGKQALTLINQRIRS
mgnify:CR=1 FL=1